METLLKARLDDYDDRGFDLVRRHVYVTGNLSETDVASSFSDEKQRKWRNCDPAGHNNAVARAEIFSAQAHAGLLLDVRTEP